MGMRATRARPTEKKAPSPSSGQKFYGTALKWTVSGGIEIAIPDLELYHSDLDLSNKVCYITPILRHSADNKSRTELS